MGRKYYRPQRCPKCGSNRISLEESHYGNNYYICRTCNRHWEPHQIIRAYEAPFSHMLWDFKNQNEDTLEYDFKEDDTRSWTGKGEKE